MDFIDALREIKAGNQVEYKTKKSGWSSLNERLPYLNANLFLTDGSIGFRMKRKSVHVDDLKFPEPLRSFEELEDVLYYFVVLNYEGVSVSASRFDSDKIDYGRLAAGLVHTTKEAADMHAAVLSEICQRKGS